MNIGNQSHYGYEQPRSAKPKYILGAFALFACVAFVAQMGHSWMKTDSSVVSLWEKSCYDCVKCSDDKIEIISATFGTHIITTDMIHRYNNGERTFPAGDATWGNRAWEKKSEDGSNLLKKTMVLTYRLCDKWFTRIIEEGQALVLP